MPSISNQDQRLRLLVVEDEFIIANQIARFFVQQGVELVGFAPTVSRARQVLDSGATLDAAILDVRLGSTDVFEVADRLSATGTCVLFYTGLDPDSLPPRFRNTPVVSKSEGLDKLLKTIKSVYRAQQGLSPFAGTAPSLS